jgi:hypothetical protein
MAFLVLGNIAIPVEVGSFESDALTIGDVARSASGRLRAAVNGFKYIYNFTTTPLTAPEASAITALFGSVVSASGERFSTPIPVLVEPSRVSTLMMQHSSGWQNAALQLEIRLTEQ